MELRQRRNSASVRLYVVTINENFMGMLELGCGEQTNTAQNAFGNGDFAALDLEICSVTISASPHVDQTAEPCLAQRL